MTLPTNGITADVIRDIMPPYQLNTDLVAAMLAAVPPPPSHATTSWRQARVARLVQELAGMMPADAPQARIAAEIVIAREAVENTLGRANAPGLAGGAGVPAAADCVRPTGLGRGAGAVAGASPAEAGAILRHRAGRWS